MIVMKLVMKLVMIVVRMMMTVLTVFACTAHRESEDGGGIAVAVAVVLKLA